MKCPAGNADYNLSNQGDILTRLLSDQQAKDLKKQKTKKKSVICDKEKHQIIIFEKLEITNIRNCHLD